MLTNVYENGVEKCNHYWPYDKNQAKYGDFGVTILKENVDRDWTITEFLLDKVSRRGWPVFLGWEKTYPYHGASWLIRNKKPDFNILRLTSLWCIYK